MRVFKSKIRMRCLLPSLFPTLYPLHVLVYDSNFNIRRILEFVHKKNSFVWLSLMILDCLNPIVFLLIVASLMNTIVMTHLLCPSITKTFPYSRGDSKIIE